MSTSLSPSEDDGSRTIWNIKLPRRMVILPPVALALGFAIGMSRGGSRARLRFLAENAHRQPTTIQGWYFYTKTRNYRILFGAARQGAKDGLLLGAATAGYVLAEEGAGQLRRTVQDSTAEGPGWKGKAVDTGKPSEGFEWFDGGMAGGVMGVAISLLYRFQTTLILRTSLMGVILGASEGGLRILQRRIGKLKEDQEKKDLLDEPTPLRETSDGQLMEDVPQAALG